MTREDVIEGLKMSYTYSNVDDGNTLVPQQLVLDALALLKAQEPRLVTIDDFKDADEAGFIPTWCEEKDTGEVYCECISIGALEDAKFGHMRWWTSRPDEKRRAETPWDC